VHATLAPKTRRISGCANNTTPINRLVSSVVRINQLTIAILELGKHLFDLFDIVLRQFLSLREVRDERCHLTIEKAIQEPIGFLCQHCLTRNQRSVEEPTTVLTPRDSPFFDQARQERLDRAFMPTSELLNTFNDLSGRERVLAPKRVEHMLF